MKIFCLALGFAGFAIALGLPIYRTAVTGRFWPPFFRMWIYLIVWSILFSFVVPGLVEWAFHDEHVWAYFIEGPAIVAMFFMGWVYPLILCGITLGIRALWVRWRSRTD